MVPKLNMLIMKKLSPDKDQKEIQKSKNWSQAIISNYPKKKEITIIIIIMLEVEQGSFTPLTFTATGGMSDECKRYHSRLVELSSTKKGEDYSTTMSWINAKVSFTLLRSALLCLRGSRCMRRTPVNITDNDFGIDKGLYNDVNATRAVIGRCPWSIRVQIHGWRHGKLVIWAWPK